MACVITFDNDATTGLFSGATWNTSGIVELLGYSTTDGGTYGAGGNWPWTTNSWGASVDTSNIQEGFYKFKYKSSLPSSDPCYGEIIFYVSVVQGTVTIADKNITLCSGDATRNIFNDSGLYALSGINPVDAVIDGSGTASPGYTAGLADDVTDDTYNPTTETTFPVTRVFTITYTPTAPAGYALNNCGNCDPITVTVTYEVHEDFQTGTVNNNAVCNDGTV